jgi:hypothetical protein
VKDTQYCSQGRTQSITHRKTRHVLCCSRLSIHMSNSKIRTGCAERGQCSCSDRTQPHLHSTPLCWAARNDCLQMVLLTYESNTTIAGTPCLLHTSADLCSTMQQPAAATNVCQYTNQHTPLRLPLQQQAQNAACCCSTSCSGSTKTHSQGQLLP